MENERIRQRLDAGDLWVNDRMEKVLEVEDLAEEMKHLRSQQRLERTKRCWSTLEKDHEQRVGNNRLKQIERLRPLAKCMMGLDLEKLCMQERISPLMHRNEALMLARQSVAQEDRIQAHHELKAAKEAVRLNDLSYTRKNAEDRAESMWRLANAIPLTATMDSLRPGLLPINPLRPSSAPSATDDKLEDDGDPENEAEPADLGDSEEYASGEVDMPPGEGHLTI